MKFALLSLLVGLVIGFDGADSDGSGVPSKPTNVNVMSLPGYMGDVVIQDQYFESYLVPTKLDAAAIDLLTAPELEWVAIASTTFLPKGAEQHRIVRKSTGYSANEIVLQNETRISFRYGVGSGAVIESDVSCEGASFDKFGMELQCSGGPSKAEFLVYLVARNG